MSGHAYTVNDQILVAGEWLQGKGETIDDLDPFTEKPLLTLTAATPDDVDAACRAAKEAQLSWAEQPPAARAALMNRAADIIEARKDEIAEWIVHESGGTKVKAALECMLVTSFFRAAAVLPYMCEGRILPEDIPGKESRAYRKPAGVVALISPWNFPLQLSTRTLAPALALGNGVVIKPASDTPVTGGLLLGRILEEAGLPKGLVSVLPGSGSVIGQVLIKHAIPRVVSFTGSTTVGRGIAKAASEAEVLKKVELELGGNGPIVVLDDADIDRAVEASVWGKFMHSGQICMIANRVIVEKTAHDRFTEAFVERTRQLKVGDPDAPDNFIGPLINRSQRDNVVDLIARARQEGATCLLDGEPQGLVVPPHVFTDLKADSCLLKEEIFGPVVGIQKVTDEDEALASANATDYGLSSAVFSGDVARGLAFAQRVEAGMTHVNDQPVNDSPFAPFGGEKNSGIGRFNGNWAIDAFTTDHWITVQHAPRPLPFSVADFQY